MKEKRIGDTGRWQGVHLPPGIAAPGTALADPPECRKEGGARAALLHTHIIVKALVEVVSSGGPWGVLLSVGAFVEVV